MANKIPPSLNWLIKKRARLAGEIRKTRKALSKVQSLVDKLKSLEDDLDTIDKSLKLHTIQIDVNNIKPVRPKKPLLMFPRGDISKYVMRYLKLNGYERPVTKTEIVEYIIKIHDELYSCPLPYVNFSDAVKQALVRNMRENRIVRCHHPITREVGLWMMAKPSHVRSI